MTKTTNPEAILEGLTVGTLIQRGANGRWSPPSPIVSIDLESTPSGYGGTFRMAETAFGERSTISSSLSSRDYGRFWRLATDAEVK